ncbi:MAG: hypothetical protein WDM81_07315 [Rhizomicrobium sp.]
MRGQPRSKPGRKANIWSGAISPARQIAGGGAQRLFHIGRDQQLESQDAFPDARKDLLDGGEYLPCEQVALVMRPGAVERREGHAADRRRQRRRADGRQRRIGRGAEAQRDRQALRQDAAAPCGVRFDQIANVRHEVQRAARQALRPLAERHEQARGRTGGAELRDPADGGLGQFAPRKHREKGALEVERGDHGAGSDLAAVGMADAGDAALVAADVADLQPAGDLGARLACRRREGRAEAAERAAPHAARRASEQLERRAGGERIGGAALQRAGGGERRLLFARRAFGQEIGERAMAPAFGRPVRRRVFRERIPARRRGGAGSRARARAASRRARMAASSASSGSAISVLPGQSARAGAGGVAQAPWRARSSDQNSASSIGATSSAKGDAKKPG